MTKDSSVGLVLSLFEYTLRKDFELAKIAKTMPQKAKYTSPEIQNKLLETMSNIVTEEIVRQIGDQWYTIKVDSTRDPIGQENIAIIVHYVGENCEASECLLAMATSEKGEA